jgi:Ca2+-binding RTX toxin-like protein
LNTLTGGVGNDTYVTNGFSTNVIEAANAGIDTVISFESYTLAANVENLTLVNNSATGTGNELNNIITGNSVANILDGGAGVDTLIGGLGDDTYVVDSVSDVVTENVNAGIDWVQASSDYTLSANVENLTLLGSAMNGTGNTLNNILTGNAYNNVLSGLEGVDTLNGGDGNDSLFGGANNDILNGGAGDDLLDGGLDEGFIGTQTSEVGDRLFGGLGNDTYIVNNRADLVTEAENQGFDTIQTSANNYALPANVEVLILTGNAVTGLGNNFSNALNGNALNNNLFGFDGNDILNGGAGIDFLDGGLGDDFYVLGDTSVDTVFENANAGIDTVAAVFNYTLSANVENLILQGTALTGTGNSLNNTIDGNELNNSLNGSDGNDRLFGFDGSDFLDGGNDNDFIDGGNGNDLIFGGAGNDFIDGGNDDDNIFADAGNDIILGGNGNDAISGNAGFDTLTGGAGADSFRFHTPFDGIDTITDFSVADDTITVFASSFGAGLIAGSPLQNFQFSLGSSTTTVSTSVRFVYDANNGGLFFDPNGGTNGDRIQLATLSPQLLFSAADIFVAF